MVHHNNIRIDSSTLTGRKNAHIALHQSTQDIVAEESSYNPQEPAPSLWWGLETKTTVDGLIVDKHPEFGLRRQQKQVHLPTSVRRRPGDHHTTESRIQVRVGMRL